MESRSLHNGFSVKTLAMHNLVLQVDVTCQANCSWGLLGHVTVLENHPLKVSWFERGLNSSTPGRPNSTGNWLSIRYFEFSFPQITWKMCFLILCRWIDGKFSFHKLVCGIQFSTEYTGGICVPLSKSLSLKVKMRHFSMKSYTVDCGVRMASLSHLG